jgi:hypothetical protein
VAGIFDQLFGVAPPESAQPGGALPRSKVPKRPGYKKPKATKDGLCRSCGTELFWAGSCYVQIEKGVVEKHNCHRTLPEDFDDLT